MFASLVRYCNLPGLAETGVVCGGRGYGCGMMDEFFSCICADVIGTNLILTCQLVVERHLSVFVSRGERGEGMFVKVRK